MASVRRVVARWAPQLSLAEPEASLLQAAHIIDDRAPLGAATMVNGIALCAIHHLAYYRNLLGIDPRGVVHIALRLLDEIDGPMLRSGLQSSTAPRSSSRGAATSGQTAERLLLRFERFSAAA
jgi:putative restriction endonuclease